jgi:hypothetical protein
LRRSLDSSSFIFFAKLGEFEVTSLRSLAGGVKLFSHSFIIAEAVRLMLLGVKLFRADHAASSRFGPKLAASAYCRPFDPRVGLMITVSKFGFALLSFHVLF